MVVALVERHHLVEPKIGQISAESQGGAANAVRRTICLKVASLDVTRCISTKLFGWWLDIFDNTKEG